MKTKVVARPLIAPFVAVVALAGVWLPGAVPHDDGSQVCLGSRGTVVCVPPEPAPG